MYKISWHSDLLVYLPVNYLIFGRVVIFKEEPQTAINNGSVTNCVKRLILIKKFGIIGYFLPMPNIDPVPLDNAVKCFIFAKQLPEV